ncbi:MAG: 2,3,4,5-tetrahydropyridine-2,6-dicarboxylate N-succinyltransferase [Candidatus Eisenbacteria bacterium]|nr:2,3,4,5-tetrahydropyridine-2,6-dicarboxylate N-succinyltransferase [Candidatus Eisenbacteria bacterium]
MSNWDQVRAQVEAAWADPGRRSEPATREAVDAVLAGLDCGQLRVCERPTEEWVTHAWIKQAILLYFGQRSIEEIEIGPFHFRDKIPLKHAAREQQIRVVPPATIRFGAFLEPGVICMPSYVNVGAWVGAGSMVDTWATVGSCAQVGRNVHLSGGVGIGGVLEPPQASPVIIEDHAFLGSRAIVVEGVRVSEGAVLGAGVVLTASTPIVDVRGAEAVTSRCLVPPRAVVIPGTMPKRFPAGEYQVPCALIIGERSASTDAKTSLNQVLREFPGVA